jgi:hypothetical protein
MINVCEYSERLFEFQVQGGAEKRENLKYLETNEGNLQNFI